MTDKKLTVEDVVEGLERCISTTNAEACAGCPFNKQNLCDKDHWTLERYALDLIKRQKAEIVNLKDYNEELLAEIRKLKGSTIVDNVTENQERIRREAEAYKAFAEHSKEKWWFNTTRMVGEEE